MDDLSIAVKVRAYGISNVNKETLVHIPGKETTVAYEISGVISDVAHNVTTVRPGHEVVGLLPLASDFTGSECVTLNEFGVVKKPNCVSHLQAAGCIADGVKAYTALHYLGHLCPGDTVLLLIGNTHSAYIALQLAHQWGAKVLVTCRDSEEEELLKQVSSSVARVVYTDTSHTLVSQVMEETGGLGADIVVDSGVTLFKHGTNNDDDKLFHPHKQDVINCLAVGGRWVTSTPNLQLDPPESRLLYMKAASLCFLFEHAWMLSTSQHGCYHHVLNDFVDKLANGSIRTREHRIVDKQDAEIIEPSRVHKVVVKL